MADEMVQTMPATTAAVEFARGLAKVSVLPEELQGPVAALIESALEMTVGAKRELAPGVLRVLDVAVALQKVPERGTGAFAG